MARPLGHGWGVRGRAGGHDGQCVMACGAPATPWRWNEAERGTTGPCTSRVNPIGVAVPHVPEGEWPRASVSATDRRRRADARKKMIVALARTLLVAFWRMVTTGEITAGVVLRSAVQRRRGQFLAVGRTSSANRASGVAATRGTPWLQCRGKNVPGLGDSPSKRMAASWPRFSVNLTEYKVAVRSQHPDGELPPDCRSRADRKSML